MMGAQTMERQHVSLQSPVQGELLLQDHGMSLEQFVEYLNDRAPRPVSVRLTKNRVSMISIDFSTSAVKIRMHEQFLMAPKQIVQALRRYVRTHRKAMWRIVSSYGRNIVALHDRDSGGKGSEGRGRRTRLTTLGQVHDLKRISDEVNHRYFNGRVSCRIGWGRSIKRKRRRKLRSVRFGSWSRDSRIIRIHPILDDSRVPANFVRYIVFHEMLHTVVPSVRRNERQYDHSPEFRKLEMGFPNCREMDKLAGKLVDKLGTARRSGL